MPKAWNKWDEYFTTRQENNKCDIILVSYDNKNYNITKCTSKVCLWGTFMKKVLIKRKNFCAFAEGFSWKYLILGVIQKS